MRPIKFRAWDKVNKTMWSEVQNAYDTIHHHAEDNSTGFEGDLMGRCFQDVLDDDDYVVMQFTGLFDNNGKEIYEGDVIETRLGRKQIIYSDDVAGFEAVGGCGSRSLYGYAKDRDLRLIGNIHENPELLK